LKGKDGLLPWLEAERENEKGERREERGEVKINIP
jgi:hypothetical protein